MSHSNEEQIRALVAAKAGLPFEVVHPRSRLLQDLGIGGDDAAELLASFSAKYGIDMNGFDFDHYFPPEPTLWSIIKRQWTRQHRQAELTVGDLISVANTGTWPNAPDQQFLST